MHRRYFLGLGLPFKFKDDLVCDSGLGFSVNGLTGFVERNPRNIEGDDSEYLQKILDSGGSIVFPPDRKFFCKVGLVVKFDGQVISGGEFVFDQNIIGHVAVRILASHVEINGAKLISSSRAANSVGLKTTGILIEGNDSFVHGCVVDGFQMGVCVAPTGEFFRHRIHHNSIINVVGSGGGPDDSKSSLGEDRGDGITVWGSVASILGNVVTALPGTDARCGIFFEALAEYKSIKSASGDEFCVISGNSVSGSFRRSIDCEEIDNCIISSNICSAGVWAVIQVSQGSRNSVVTGNVIRFSRRLDDLTGEAWSPWRCAINVYSSARNIIISNNSVEVLGFGYGIYLNGLKDHRVSNVSVLGNIIDFANQGVGVGFVCSFGSRVRFSENKIVNLVVHKSGSFGVLIRDSEDVFLLGNDLETLGGGAAVVQVERVKGFCEISDNNLYAEVGLDVRDAGSIFIRRNRFFKNKRAIKISNKSVALISENYFSSRVDGREICDDSSSCRIFDNFD